MKEPVTETETPKTAPILEIAWLRHADLDSAASRRTKAFLDIRKLIAWLGVLATLFAILTQQPIFTDTQSLQGVIVKILFIAIPCSLPYLQRLPASITPMVPG